MASSTFNTKVLPVLNELEAEWEEKRKAELVQKSKSARSSMMGGIGPDGGANAMWNDTTLLRSNGEWTRKTTDDFLSALTQKLKEKGIEVTPEIKQDIINHFISQKMPKSTTEYILKKIEEGNVFSAGNAKPRTALEGHIKVEAEKKFNASDALETVADVATFISNTVVTAGQGLIASIVGQSAIEAGVSATDSTSQKANDYMKEAKKQAQEQVAAANKKSVSIPKWMMEKMKLEDLSSASADKLTNALNWAAENAYSYRQKINEAVRNGESTVKRSGSNATFTLTEATVRAKEYEALKDAVALELGKRMEFPAWMIRSSRLNAGSIGEASDKSLVLAKKWADGMVSFYQKKMQMANERGQTSIMLDSKKMSIQDATVRLMEYKAFASSIEREQTARKESKGVSYDHIEEASESEEVQMGENTTMSEKGAPAPAQGETPAQKQAPSIWDNLMGSTGLAGSGETFRNFGLSLANLPDMLVNLFTGKMRSEGMNGSMLLPFALLIGGTFIKSPVLKVAMMLWGGLNLLNKSTQYGNERYGEKQAPEQKQGTSYKKYADEPLNERMKSPQIEGNTLVVSVDNVPRVITLPPTLIDAYKTGAVPLNTLANRCLSKIDQQQNIAATQNVQVSEQFENSQTREQSKGLR